MMMPNLRRVVAQVPRNLRSMESRRNFCAPSFPTGKESNGPNLTFRWYFYRGVVFAAGFSLDWYRSCDHPSKREEELNAELRKAEKKLEKLRKPILFACDPVYPVQNSSSRYYDV